MQKTQKSEDALSLILVTTLGILFDLRSQLSYSYFKDKKKISVDMEFFSFILRLNHKIIDSLKVDSTDNVYSTDLYMVNSYTDRFKKISEMPVEHIYLELGLEYGYDKEEIFSYIETIFDMCMTCGYGIIDSFCSISRENCIIKYLIPSEK